jgi:hypothetical protein
LRLEDFNKSMYSRAGFQPSFLFVGDSMFETSRGQGLNATFRSNFGNAGNKLLDGNVSAGATVDYDACLKWITGQTFRLPNNGIVEFGESTQPVISDKLTLYYNKQVGGGSFKIQTKRNGAAWVDEAGYTSIDTNCATVGDEVGVVITITKAISDRSASYRIRAVGLGGGSLGYVNIIGAGAWDTRSIGAINSWMTNSSTGINNTNNAKTTRRIITDPIMAVIAPDIILFSNYDGSTSATDDLPTLVSNLKLGVATNGANPVPSILLIGPPTGYDQPTDDGTKAQAKAMRNISIANNYTYWDNRVWAGGWQSALARGLILVNDVHYKQPAISQWPQLMLNDLSLVDSAGYGHTNVSELRIGNVRLRRQSYNADGNDNQLGLEGGLRLAPVYNPATNSLLGGILQFENTAGAADTGDIASLAWTSGSFTLAMRYGGVVTFTSGSGQGVTLVDAAATSAEPKGLLGTLTAPMKTLNLGKSTAASPGDRTITGGRVHGTLIFSAGSSTPIVITNQDAIATANIFAQVYGTDTTLTSVRITRAAGSFTVTPNAAATANTTVGWFILP